MIATTFSLLESFISVFIASKVTDILAIGRKRKLQGWKERGGVLMKRFSRIYLLRDTLVQLLAAFSFSNSIRRFWAGLEFYCLCHHQIIQALRLFRSNSSAKILWIFSSQEGLLCDLVSAADRCNHWTLVFIPMPEIWNRLYAADLDIFGKWHWCAIGVSTKMGGFKART